MLAKQPFYNRDHKYVSFSFETEKEAEFFRNICKFLEIGFYDGDKYKKVVYIKQVELRGED